jgi:hypothetical protein
VDDFDDHVVVAWPRLLRSAWLLTGDWHLAEDLLRTALVKTARRWHRVAGASPDGCVRRVLATTYPGVESPAGLVLSIGCSGLVAICRSTFLIARDPRNDC